MRHYTKAEIAKLDIGQRLALARQATESGAWLAIASIILSTVATVGFILISL